MVDVDTVAVAVAVADDEAADDNDDDESATLGEPETASPARVTPNSMRARVPGRARQQVQGGIDMTALLPSEDRT